MKFQNMFSFQCFLLEKISSPRILTGKSASIYFWSYEYDDSQPNNVKITTLMPFSFGMHEAHQWATELRNRYLATSSHVAQIIEDADT